MSKRKYADVWRALVRDKVGTYMLQPVTMTDEQAAANSATLCRAISKEKYEDIHFKRQYPQARLDFKTDLATRTVTITLTLTPEEAQLKVL